MLRQIGSKVYLRALEPGDIDFLYAVENDENIWEVSDTIVPFSRYILGEYLENVHRDIYEVKQLRLSIVEKKSQQWIGFVDLYDFDPKNSRVGLGIVIYKTTDRGKGYGKETVQLMESYCFNRLNINQIYVHIGVENTVSLELFTKLNFEMVGTKKQWTYKNGSYHDEWLLQKIKN